MGTIMVEFGGLNSCFTRAFWVEHSQLIGAGTLRIEFPLEITEEGMPKIVSLFFHPVNQTNIKECSRIAHQITREMISHYEDSMDGFHSNLQKNKLIKALSQSVERKRIDATKSGIKMNMDMAQISSPSIS
jgi:hypothetical protein